MIPVLALGGWGAGWLAAGPARRLPDHDEADGGSDVSIVVPVRDEELRLPALLAALRRDRPERGTVELIVVDDESSDRSAALADAAGARVLHTSPPPGWTGKAWACQLGAESASGRTVVFLDADTVPEPGFVARLAGAAEALDGMVSVQPRHRVVRLYEEASGVCNIVALMAGTGVTRPGGETWWRRPVGFGPAIAVPRRRYLAAGGHRPVRAKVAEDLALAASLHDAGIPVAAYVDGGRPGISYRMYPDGPRRLAEGWTKNLSSGATSIAPIRTALVAWWVTGALSAAAAAVAGPARPAGYALYGMFVAQMALLLRRAGRFRLVTALAYPLPLAAFVGLFVRSAARRLTGRAVRWRGRPVAA